MIKQQFWLMLTQSLHPRTVLSSLTWLMMSSVFFGVSAIFPQVSRAVTKIDIACDTEANQPSVLGIVSNEYRSQNTEILSFPDKYFSPKTALKKCQTTANTLKKLYRAGEMNYLSSDALNGKPTVCVVERRGVGCDHYNSQILFSLDKTVDPSQVLYDMLGKGFKQSQLPTSRTVGRIYTNIRPSWWPF